MEKPMRFYSSTYKWEGVMLKKKLALWTKCIGFHLADLFSRWSLFTLLIKYKSIILEGKIVSKENFTLQRYVEKADDFEYEKLKI